MGEPQVITAPGHPHTGQPGPPPSPARRAPSPPRVRGHGTAREGRGDGDSVAAFAALPPTLTPPKWPRTCFSDPPPPSPPHHGVGWAVCREAADGSTETPGRSWDRPPLEEGGPRGQPGSGPSTGQGRACIPGLQAAAPRGHLSVHLSVHHPPGGPMVPGTTPSPSVQERVGFSHRPPRAPPGPSPFCRWER